MNTCGVCGKEYSDDRHFCTCGGGIIASDDEDFLDFLDEQDGNGF